MAVNLVETTKLADLLKDEFEREAASTRRTLERVPEGQNDWKPHPRSMELGYLASLVATLPSWVISMVERDEFDIRSSEAQSFKPLQWSKRSELIEAHEKSVAQACDALSHTTDDHLFTPWKFLVAGHVVSESPRHIAIRDSVLSHLAHHRGQLTVYLRLNEAPVPAIYGPSADEGKFA
jgi:uncharacterized damage-inducible protein DinB